MQPKVDPPFDPNCQKFLEIVTANSQGQQSELLHVDPPGSVGSQPVHWHYSAAAGLPPSSWQFAHHVLESPVITLSAGEVQKDAEAYTSETMTSPTREEISLQFQNARLQVDKDLLAAKQAEVEFRSEIKVMISQQGESFQTLRSDINKAVGESNLNVERLRSEMHKESAVNLRWIVTTMIAIGLATAGTVSWIVKSSIDGRLATTATAVVAQPVTSGTATTSAPAQSAPALTK